MKIPHSRPILISFGLAATALVLSALLLLEWRSDNTPALLPDVLEHEGFTGPKIAGPVWGPGEALAFRLSDKDLKAYLTQIEEAKKRDHRKLGRELGLFTFHPWAPGAAFWLAKGTTLYNTLASYMREVLFPLQRLPLAPEVWEGQVLPLRMDYRPELLDQLCTSGEVVWPISISCSPAKSSTWSPAASAAST